eukprot:scaffold324374_cov61-Tisochrysis_lutea.AAC.1
MLRRHLSGAQAAPSASRAAVPRPGVAEHTAPPSSWCTGSADRPPPPCYQPLDTLGRASVSPTRQVATLTRRRAQRPAGLPRGSASFVRPHCASRRLRHSHFQCPTPMAYSRNGPGRPASLLLLL